MSFSDPTPENMQAAADAFEASYGTGTRLTPHHVSVLLRAGSDRISELEDSQRVLQDLLRRYRTEVADGFHPYMILEEVDAALPPIPDKGTM